jgi:hypothetical protein
VVGCGVVGLGTSVSVETLVCIGCWCQESSVSGRKGPILGESSWGGPVEEIDRLKKEKAGVACTPS